MLNSFHSNVVKAHPVFVALVHLFVLFPLAILKADTFTWSGASGGTWDTVTASNWGGNLWNNARPDSAIFDATGVGTVNIVSSGITAQSLTFNTTGYTIASNTLTMGGTTPTITTGTGVTAIISSGVAGAAGLVKAGDGTLTFSTQKTYTGGTTINAGILDLTGGGGSAGTIRGTVNINTGGTLRLSTGDATGYGGGASALTTININGGTLAVNTTSNQTLGNATINMTGGTITGIANSNLDFFGGSSALNTLASATTSTISGTISPVRQGNTTFNVADGAAAIDLNITGVLRTAPSGDATSGTLIKAGAGTMQLSGFNTFTRSTTVNAGTLNLAAGGTTGTLLGALNVNAGGTVNTTVGDALGYATGLFTPTVNVSGGTFNNAVNANQGYSTNFNLTGGTVSSTGGGAIHFNTGIGIASLASSTTSTWSAPITIRGGTLGITTAQGTTASGIDLTIGGSIGQSGGTFGIAKNGLGTLALTGNSTYTGGTTVNAGVLDIRGGGGSTFGAIRGTVTVNSGATLRLTAFDALGYGTGTDRVTAINLNGGTLNVGSTLNETMNAAITMTGATINGVANSQIDFLNNGASVTTLASATTSTISVTNLNIRQDNTTFTVADGAAAVDLQVSSNIGEADGIGNNNLIKAGAGKMVVSGNNTYTGTTSINEGTLNIRHANSLGTVAGATSVASGATLEVEGGITVAADALTINGAGVGSGGALRNISGNNAYTGTITLGSNASIASDAGTLTLNNATAISGAGLGLTVGGAGNTTISSVIGTGSGTLTKSGSGVLTLSGINTFTGGTTVNGGTLNLNNGGGTGAVRGVLNINSGATVNANTVDALGYNPGLVVSNVNLNGGTLNNATTGNQGFLTNFNLTNGTVTSSGGGSFNFSSGFGINSLASSGESTWSAPIVIRSGNLVVDTALGSTTSGIDLTISGAISQNGGTFGLIKNGLGTLSLTGNNTYTGTTTVNAGNLLINGTLATGNQINIGSTGALNGTGTINRNVTLSGDGIINKASGTIAGTLTVNGGNWNGNGNVTGIVTANSGTFKIGSGANLSANSGLNVSGTSSISGGNAASTITGNVNYTSSTSSSFQGVIAGTGSTLTMNNAAATLNLTGANTYTGGTTVTAGTLSVNNSTGSGTGSGTVTIGSGGVLAGSGSIAGIVNFQSGSLHTPGNSPGVVTLAGGANYFTGSAFQWELTSNADDLSGRGTTFDGVDVTGGTLTIGSGVTSNLVFNGTGSSVLWSNSFWDASRQWLVFDNLNLPTLTSGIFTGISVSNDSAGFSLSSQRGSFAWTQSGNDIFLSYTAVPEPTTIFSCILLGSAGLAYRRRKRIGERRLQGNS